VVAQDEQDLAAERGLSSFDQRHKLTGDYVIELPFGTGKKWLNNSGFTGKTFGDWTLTGCWQTHSADVRVVHNQQEAQPKPNVLGDDKFCDALVSNTPNILLTVKTADCVPLLFGDPKTGAFAAVHAGWRGTSASIVLKAIAQLQSEYGARPEDLRCAIGPAANTCCYEVGSDVIERFKELFPQSDHLFTPTQPGHARIDLQTANRDQLIAAGISPERIHIAPLCTMDRNDLFFSYRREKKLRGRVGRLMSVIGRP